MRRFERTRVAVLAGCVLLATALTAAADPPAGDASAARQAAAQEGPLVVEAVRPGFVVTPDFKMTKFDGATRSMAGAYGGWLIDDQFLIGLGGYWLTGDNDDRSLGYGGFVLGWTAPVGSAVQVGVRALVGVGRAKLTDTASIAVPQYVSDGDPRNVTWTQTSVQFRTHEDFVVFEPQVELVAHVNRWLAITAGGGYRAVGDADWYGSRIRGAVGSVGLRFTTTR